MKALLVLVALAACTPAQRVHVNRAGAALAAASIACDWRQTRSAADESWSRGRTEGNVIMGPTPTTTTVDAYMGAAIAATIVLGQLVPERWRPFFYGAVVGIEAKVVVDNIPQTGFCL